MTTASPMSQGEFGAVASGRILALLGRYGIKSTWFTPGYTIESFPAAVAQVVAAGHEIGHHGWTHTPPTQLTREQEEAELVRGNEAIRKLTGSYARGYRSPSWDLTEHTIDLLLEHNFIYESSLMGNDYTPYRARTGDVVQPGKPFQFGTTTSLVEMPISWSLDDAPHFLYMRLANGVQQGLMPAAGVLQNWLDDFHYMKQFFDWGILTYTCHPFVIGRGHRMLMLERLVSTLTTEGAQFTTMERAVQEFLAIEPELKDRN